MPTQTFDEISDFLDCPPPDHVALVGAGDPELGPFAKWIHVPESAVEQHCLNGYRKLSRSEKEALFGDVEAYTDDWKHSD